MLFCSYAISHPVTVIGPHDAALEIRFQSMQDLHISLMLNNGEFR